MRARRASCAGARDRAARAVLRWWRRCRRLRPANSVDPLTLDPCSAAASVRLVEPSGVVHRFDAGALISWMRASGEATNPLSRRVLTSPEIRRVIRAGTGPLCGSPGDLCQVERGVLHRLRVVLRDGRELALQRSALAWGEEEGPAVRACCASVASALHALYGALDLLALLSAPTAAVARRCIADALRAESTSGRRPVCDLAVMRALGCAVAAPPP